MVFVDLSTSEKINLNENLSTRLASPTDRLLSFFIDFLLISPVAGLFSAGALKELKESMIENASSSILVANIVIYLLIFFLMTWLLQAAFIHFWNATPGQRFLSLRVVRFPQEKISGSLSFTQCLTRAAGPWLSFLALGIPTLEIFSHSWRRTFYDRLSDTLVITLKRQGEKPPLPFEAQFIRQWMQVTSFLLLFVGVFQVASFFLEGQSLSSKFALKPKVGCPDVNLFSNQKYSRLDRALSLYLVSSEDLSCLEKELARTQVFKKEPTTAYLAKYLVEKDDDLKLEYQKHLCKSAPDSAECAWTKKLPEIKTAGSLSLQILQAQNWVKTKNWTMALEALDSLVQETLLFDGLQKSYIQAYFSLHKAEEIPSRTPASANSQKAVENFKKRYGVK